MRCARPDVAAYSAQGVFQFAWAPGRSSGCRGSLWRVDVGGCLRKMATSLARRCVPIVHA
eukprot:336275-Alexandrium_andersonii.AAC.1